MDWSAAVPPEAQSQPERSGQTDFQRKINPSSAPAGPRGAEDAMEGVWEALRALGRGEDEGEEGGGGFGGGAGQGAPARQELIVVASLIDKVRHFVAVGLCAMVG